MTIIKIQKGGIITIPKAMREALNIKPGDIDIQGWRRWYDLYGVWR